MHVNCFDTDRHAVAYAICRFYCDRMDSTAVWVGLAGLHTCPSEPALNWFCSVGRFFVSAHACADRFCFSAHVGKHTPTVNTRETLSYHPLHPPFNTQMVRKKLKKASQGQHSAPGYSGTQRGDGDGDSNNLRNAVETWLEYLNLALGADPLPPPVSPRLDVFGVLGNCERGPFAQVRSLQGLRTRVQKIAAAHEERPAASSAADHLETVTPTAERQEIHLVFLISLLLYMDTDTGSLRKAIKGLLLTAEKAAISMGGTSTDDIVHVVSDRFLDRSLVMTSRILPATAATTVSTCATATEAASGVWAITASGHGKLHAQVEVPCSEADSSSLDPYAAGSKASEAENANCTVRIARSLQWLVDTPGGKRVLLDNTARGADNLAGSESGDVNLLDSGRKLSTFGKSFALLDLLLQTQTGSRPTGSGTTDVVGGAEHVEGDGGDGAPSCPRLDGSAGSLDSCSEVLKATAFLMSLNK